MECNECGRAYSTDEMATATTCKSCAQYDEAHAVNIVDQLETELLHKERTASWYDKKERDNIISMYRQAIAYQAKEKTLEDVYNFAKQWVLDYPMGDVKGFAGSLRPLLTRKPKP